MRFNDTIVATGTGFVVEHDAVRLLVTNRHNVSGRRSDNNQPMHASGALPNSVEIVHNVHGKLGAWWPRVEPLWDEEDRPLWYEHPAFGWKADVVALPLTQLDGVAIYPHDPWTTEPTSARESPSS